MKLLKGRRGCPLLTCVGCNRCDCRVAAQQYTMTQGLTCYFLYRKSSVQLPHPKMPYKPAAGRLKLARPAGSPAALEGESFRGVKRLRGLQPLPVSHPARLQEGAEVIRNRLSSENSKPTHRLQTRCVQHTLCSYQLARLSIAHVMPQASHMLWHCLAPRS